MPCKKRTLAWDLIYNNLNTYLEEKTSSNSDLDKMTINKVIVQIIGDNTRSQVFDDFRTHASKVKIRLGLTTLLTKSLRINPKKSKALLTDLLSTLVSLFKEHIWIPRCDDLVKWETQQRITQSMKFSKESWLFRRITRRKASNTYRDASPNLDLDQSANTYMTRLERIKACMTRMWHQLGYLRY
jgi:hypothetical protein